MAQRNFGDGALRLVGPTTATTSAVASIIPVRTITAQVTAPTTGATGSITLDGSLDGQTFVSLLAATTFLIGTTATLVTTTSVDLITNIKASFTITGTTIDTAIFVAGR